MSGWICKTLTLKVWASPNSPERGLSQPAPPAQLCYPRPSPRYIISQDVCEPPFLQGTFLPAENWAPTKLNKIKSYHLYTPQKTFSIIIVKEKTCKPSSRKIISAPCHAALKALCSAYSRNGFENTAREKYVVGRRFQFSVLHPHIFHNN